MKIGIYTFHRAHNYGAVLQAYALKSFLQSSGHEVKFIDYWPDYRKGHYVPFNKKLLSLNPKGLRTRLKLLYRNLLLLTEKKKRFEQFNLFIEEYLGVSGEPLYKIGNEVPDDCDYYVYGSDQIWRVMSALFKEKIVDVVYMGKYPANNHNKIAYAASMGIIAIDSRNKEIIKECLPNFKAIGVRESSLKYALSKITERPVYHVLDPVLLLPKSKWEAFIAKTEKMIKNKYIFFYHLKRSEKAIEYVRRMSLKLNCTVIEVNEGNEMLTFKDHFPGKLSFNPVEFLSLLANAELVVSTSFHGVALSLCFEKQFVATGLGDNSGRVSSLLALLGIEKFLLSEADLNSSELSHIDYIEVNKRLDEQRRYSIDFLLSNLV